MNANNFVEFDPAVAAALSGGTRRQKQRAMTPAARRKADREAKRARSNYDLPPSLIALVKNIAARLDVPESQVAARLIIAGLQSTDPDTWDTRPSRSMRFGFNIVLPDFEK